jgi:hypothetical protein
MSLLLATVAVSVIVAPPCVVTVLDGVTTSVGEDGVGAGDGEGGGDVDVPPPPHAASASGKAATAAYSFIHE